MAKRQSKKMWGYRGRAGQFTIGDREPVSSLADLDPTYKRLLDEPVTAIVAVLGADGQPT